MSAEQTKITLIKCMRKLISEKHFDDIKIEDVCVMAHIHRRTFYRYFSDKYDLLRSVYTESFFKKMSINDSDDFWTLLVQVCQQIYKERAFFSHAFEVKGQNGFWEETINVLYPYMRKGYPFDNLTDKVCSWYVQQDMQIVFLMLEEWIRLGFIESPEEKAAQVKVSFAVHGKWTYQFAMDQQIDKFSQEKYDRKEW